MLRFFSCFQPQCSTYWFFQQLLSVRNETLTLGNIGRETYYFENFSVLGTFTAMILSLPFYSFLIMLSETFWPFQQRYIPFTDFVLHLFRKRSSEKCLERPEEIENSTLFQKIKHQNSSVLSLRNLYKSFRSKKAVDNLNLEVYPNEITILLGHN